MRQNTLCQACDETFFTDYLHPGISCPYCGAAVELIGFVAIRSCKRLASDSPCHVDKEGAKFVMQLFDISDEGVGIQTKNDLQIDAGDTVNISIENPEIKSKARVVWIDISDTCLNRAGLKFC